MARKNLCPNPAAGSNTTGYLSSGTIARATDFPVACPRTTGVRMTSGGYMRTPAAVCAAGDIFTVSFYSHNGGVFTEGSKTIYIVYTVSGSDSFPQTFSVVVGAPDATVRASFTTNAAPANTTAICLLWDSLGTGIGMTGVLLEKVPALDTYGDGETSGWVWDGIQYNSTSSFADPPPDPDPPPVTEGGTGMTHQLTPIVVPGYVDKRRGYRNDFETRIVAGPVVFTANATGTTTTIVGANAAYPAASNVVRIGDEFKLFNVTTGTLKEETVFSVTGVAVAGSTTVTFTPAAATAPISGDTVKLVGVSNQNSTAEMDRRLIALGFTAARVATLTENDKQLQIRTSDDPGSL